MEFDDFVEKWRKNQISVQVDKNKAGFMYEKPGIMPSKYRKKQALFRTLAFGGCIAGVVLFFFIQWWISILILFFGLWMFPKCQSAAATGVLDASLNSREIFQIAKDNGLFLIKQK